MAGPNNRNYIDSRRDYWPIAQGLSDGSFYLHFILGFKIMFILGVSAFYHDSAACLIKNGEVLAAAQEERFTRKKHEAGFPLNSIAYCLTESRIQPEQVAHVVFYEKTIPEI